MPQRGEKRVLILSTCNFEGTLIRGFGVFGVVGGALLGILLTDGEDGVAVEVLLPALAAGAGAVLA